MYRLIVRQCSLTVILVFLLIDLSWAGGISATRIASGLSDPLYVTSEPEDAGRLYIVEQNSGNVKVLDRATGTINPQPFFSLSGLSTGGERGLLGFAFDPNYADNNYVYANFTGPGGTTFVKRFEPFSRTPDVIDPNSAVTLISYSQPQPNHNAGWIGFGPDGYLYITSGDGGGANDSSGGHTIGIGNSQDITNNLLGKILRIDVRGDDFPQDSNRNYSIPPSNPFVGLEGDDEIWSYGLRNPWRISFDRDNGDLYIADVGQNVREEINFQPADSPGGENYGWRLREGTIATPTGGVGGPKPAGAIDPIYDYEHGGGPTEGFSVTGGYVYRGPIDSIQGNYFFSDFVTERVWSLNVDESIPSDFDGTNFRNFTDWTDQLVPDVGTINQIASFGEDADGNLYIVDLTGEIFQITPAAFSSLNGEVSLAGDGQTYMQNFDRPLRGNGATPGFPLPEGWSAVSSGVINTSTTQAFPPSPNVVRGAYNAGAGGDRILASGNTGGSEENQIQLFASIEDAEVRAIRLQFDIEAWGGDTLADSPGEAAFNVSLDVGAEGDAGNDFVREIEFNAAQPITTGLMLSPGALDGNAAENSISYDSGIVETSIDVGSAIRVIWDATGAGSTGGYLFGVDNITLRTLAAGDAQGDGDVDPADLIQLLAGGAFGQGNIDATWSQGDFDNDGDFDGTDILRIVQGLAGEFPKTYAHDPGNDVPDVLINPATGNITLDTNGTTIGSIVMDSAVGIFNGPNSPSWDAPGDFAADIDTQISMPISFTNPGYTGVDDLGDGILGDLAPGFDILADLTIKYLDPNGDLLDAEAHVIPEPSSIVLAALGLLGMFVCFWRRHSRRPKSSFIG